jgi:hypothetical protein
MKAGGRCAAKRESTVDEAFLEGAHFKEQTISEQTSKPRKNITLRCGAAWLEFTGPALPRRSFGNSFQRLFQMIKLQGSKRHAGFPRSFSKRSMVAEPKTCCSP